MALYGLPSAAASARAAGLPMAFNGKQMVVVRLEPSRTSDVGGLTIDSWRCNVRERCGRHSRLGPRSNRRNRFPGWLGSSGGFGGLWAGSHGFTPSVPPTAPRGWWTR